MAFIRKSTKLLSLRPTINRFVHKTIKSIHFKYKSFFFSLSEGLRVNASFWSVLAGKYRKFVHGTEKPIPKAKPRQPDSILEEIYRLSPAHLPYERRQEAKQWYMVHKSHTKIIEHNKKIRKLDKKIKGGLYDNWDYANKW